MRDGETAADDDLAATVEALKAGKDTILWDSEFSGFGMRVQPSGVSSYIVNYRAGDGGRKAANRRLVIGRHGRVMPEQARRIAQKTLGQVADGDDPAAARARNRAVPTLREAFDDYLAAGPKRRDSTLAVYRSTVYRDLGDWLGRSLADIERRDVEQRFQRLTDNAGWVQANNAMKMLRVLYRRQCIDFEGLNNPVDQWRAGGGRPHRPRRRRAEVFGLELVRIDMGRAVLRVDDTKSGEPLEFPVTRQLAAILERAGSPSANASPQRRGAGCSGHLEGMQHLNARIGEAGGAKFWFHALRNCFISVADRDLMLPASLTKRLVNHSRPQDVTEGYTADWTMEQLRDAAQRIADKIDELIRAGGPAPVVRAA